VHAGSLCKRRVTSRTHTARSTAAHFSQPHALTGSVYTLFRQKVLPRGAHLCPLTTATDGNSTVVLCCCCCCCCSLLLCRVTSVPLRYPLSQASSIYSIQQPKAVFKLVQLGAVQLLLLLYPPLCVCVPFLLVCVVVCCVFVCCGLDAPLCVCVSYNACCCCCDCASSPSTAPFPLLLCVYYLISVLSAKRYMRSCCCKLLRCC
jgi:hypothetical protein